MFSFDLYRSRTKIGYLSSADVSLPMFFQKRMQRVYSAQKKMFQLKLGWLPTLENTQLNILKLEHRSRYNNNWPDYLTLLRHDPSRTLRSSSAPLQ